MNENFSYKILMIDDDVLVLDKARRVLEFEGFPTQCVRSEKEALEALETFKPNLVVSETVFAGFSGFKLLNYVKEYFKETSFMFLTRNESSVNHVLALNSGAADYLTKPYDVTIFLAHIKKIMRENSDRTNLTRDNDNLKKLVEIDDLTGLYNMRSLYKKLNYELERAKRFKRKVSVLMIDVDKFKKVNDGKDHLFGSYVLSALGEIIKQSIRSIDIAARYGGDEFLIMLSECDLEGAKAFAERLRIRVEEHVFENEMHVEKVTISTGIAVSNYKDDVDSKEFVRQADLRLYEAKGAGRNCIKYIDLNEQFTENENKKVI